MRPVTTVGAVLLAFVLVGCGSTEIKDSWRDPATTAESLQFKKILVMAVVDDIVTRRVAEDELVHVIKEGKVQAVPSYTVLTEADRANLDRARLKIEALSFDGAVTMRLVKMDQKLTYVPGRYPRPYYSFWGYYGYAWPTAYGPGYRRIDTMATIETHIYALNPEKLIWSGTSETFNPGAAREVVADVARAVGKELKRQGLRAGD